MKSRPWIKMRGKCLRVRLRKYVTLVQKKICDTLKKINWELENPFSIKCIVKRICKGG
jgi:hypothetical protein